MIKTKKVVETIEHDVLDKVVCNICHREFDDETEIHEMHHVRFTGGYASVFGDGTVVTCDICQYCMKEKLGEYLQAGENVYDKYAEFISRNEVLNEKR